MTGDRTEAAVQRIETALARIARAAETTVAGPPVAGTPAAEIPVAPASLSSAPSANVLALVEKHEALRDVVALALADLDAVIAEMDP